MRVKDIHGNIWAKIYSNYYVYLNGSIHKSHQSKSDKLYWVLMLLELIFMIDLVLLFCWGIQYKLP